jgi:hypothetical protein
VDEDVDLLNKTKSILLSNCRYVTFRDIRSKSYKFWNQVSDPILSKTECIFERKGKNPMICLKIRIDKNFFV